MSGINEKKLRNKSKEIIRLAGEASDKLQEIELLVKDSNVFFKGDLYDEIYSKLETMAVVFPTVKSNLHSYSDDLLNLLSSFKAQNEKHILATKSQKIDFEVK